MLSVVKNQAAHFHSLPHFYLIPIALHFFHSQTPIWSKRSGSTISANISLLESFFDLFPILALQMTLLVLFLCRTFFFRSQYTKWCILTVFMNAIANFNSTLLFYSPITMLKGFDDKKNCKIVVEIDSASNCLHCCMVF